MAMMHDKGKLYFDKEIMHYWPEFGLKGQGKGKEYPPNKWTKPTVADVMRHQAGFSRIRAIVPVEWTSTQNIKQNKLGKLFEDHETFYPFGMKRSYHAVTRDWLSNEIFRRVEPDGRTMHEYFRDEVSPLLVKGEEIHIAVPDEKLDDCFDHVPWSLWREMMSTLRMYHTLISFTQLVKILYRMLNRMLFDPGNGNLSMDFDIDIRWNNATEPFVNSVKQRQGETPSAGTYGNARGLGKLAAIMANKGSFGGRCFLSQESWEELHADPEEQFEPLFENRTLYTKGGIHCFDSSLLKDTVK